IDLQSFRHPAANELETVREKIVSIPAGIFSTERAIRMHEMRGKTHRFLDRAFQFWCGTQLIKLPEQSNSKRVISRIAAFVLLKLEDSRQPLFLQHIPAVCLQELARALEAENNQCLVIRKLSTLVVTRQPVCAV